jgi:hypothetical protein
VLQRGGRFGVNAFFTVVWLVAWTFGGCVACSAMYGLALRECWPGAADGPLENTGPDAGGRGAALGAAPPAARAGPGGHRGGAGGGGRGPSGASPEVQPFAVRGVVPTAAAVV